MKTLNPIRQFSLIVLAAASLAACAADATTNPGELLGSAALNATSHPTKRVLSTGRLQRGTTVYPAAVLTYDSTMDASDQGSNPGIELWTDASLATRVERSNDNNGQWDYQIQGGYFAGGRAVVYGTRTGSHGPQPRTWASSGGYFLAQTSGVPAHGDALGFGGEWIGSLSSSTEVRLRVWDSAGQTIVTADFTGRPRERLRPLGKAFGPPTVWYLYRGQDGATIGMQRTENGDVFFEYWEDNCARTVALSLVAVTVADQSSGADLTPAPIGDYAGAWTGVLSSTTFSLALSGSGSSLVATANFGQGTETLLALGSQGGPPNTLYLWRPQDHATISVFLDSAGQLTAEYWENACSRRTPLNPL